MQKLTRGILVTIEGIDCCGKSTLIQNLVPLLVNLPTIFTKEPGDTPLGKSIRTMVKNLETPLAPKTEFLLYAADRAQHMHEIVKLALTEKKLIISDRMADSSVVYQGYARDLDINLIQQVNAWAMDNIVPDFTLFIDFDPKVAVQRTREKEQANNKSFFCSDPDLYYMQRAANGYHELFKNRKDVITLDGTHTPQELAQQAAKIIDKWLLKNNVYEQ